MNIMRYLGTINQWRVYFCVDMNIWLLGVSWSRGESSELDDIGVYCGPLNMQLEKYDMPRSEDDIEDWVERTRFRERGD